MMKKLILCLSLLAVPSAGHAYSVTCGQAINAILNGSDTAQALIVGHAAGAVDVLAGLICLTGGRTCGCLASVVTSRPEDYGDAYADQLLACGDDEPAFGAAMRAARDICG